MLVVRRFYIRALLPGVELITLGIRGLAPVAIGSAPALALRLALWGGHRSLGQAVAEILLFLAGTALATWVLERGLLDELRDYLRRGSLEALSDPLDTEPLPAPSA